MNNLNIEIIYEPELMYLADGEISNPTWENAGKFRMIMTDIN